MADGVISALTNGDLAELRWAHDHLEHPSLAARLSDLLASPVDGGLKLLPGDLQRRLRGAAELAVVGALGLAMTTLDPLAHRQPRYWMHKILAVGSGAVGGFFGPLTVLAELPFATLLILRSIGDVARSQGEDLTSIEARVACVQVFGLGGRSGEDDDAERGYYGLRISFGLHFESVLEFAGKGQGPQVPAATNLARAIAARFGVVVSDKTAAQLVPVAGAVSGAALNLLFMQHYQDVARGHFIVRRLERSYGVETVREAYRRLEHTERHARRTNRALEGW